jgi:hypothetical protein
MSVLTQNVFTPVQAITEKVGHFSASRPNSRGQRNPQRVAGIELLLRIRKGQFNLRRLHLNGRAAPAIWNAVLAA